MATFEYTDEMTARVVDAYVEAVEAGADYKARTEVVKALADELETSVASVRSKLVSEKVYIAQEKSKAKGSKDSMDKEAYVKALRAVTALELKSIDQATKADVKALFDFIVTASAQAEADAQV